MPRKSPRSRQKSTRASRVPARSRPRATPGRRQARAEAKREAPAATRRAHGSRRSAAPARRRATGTARAGRAAVLRRGASKRFTPPDPARVASILEELHSLYPGAGTELRFTTPLQLLIATILSAQCTDERVNLVTPVLFAKYPDAESLAAAPQADLEEVIRSTGFYRNKAKSIRACCAEIVSQHGGQVPRTLEELTALHGVGRKTANVVLGNAFGIPGLVVDTHVARLSNRLGLTREKDPVKIEFALMPIIPKERWTLFSHWLILHGRRVCNARKPRCSTCPIAAYCPRVGVTVSQ